MTRHRVSIAHLMGVVLVASLGMVALRNASPVWAGVMFLLTTGVLGLAVVAIFCRGRAERDVAWVCDLWIWVPWPGVLAGLF